MSRVETKDDERSRVIINSKNRDDPVGTTSSEFTYTLDKEVDRVSDIEVISVQIPFSYYAINANNNQLTVSAGTATLINGNYTNTTFPVMVKEALDLLGPVHTVTLSEATGMLTISQAAAFVITVGGLNDAAPSLGFTATTASLATHIGDSSASFTGTNYIVIKSSTLTRFNANPAATAAALASNIIFHTVPVDVNPGYIIIDTPRSNSSFIQLNSVDSYQTIDFRLEDDQGNLLDLNGLDWSMQLNMHIK